MLMYCRLNSRSAADWSSLSASPSARGDPVADLRRGRLAMVHAGQRRHRLGARLAAADRHMGRLVGAEDRQRVLQRLQAVAEFVKFCEGHGLSRI